MAATVRQAIVTCPHCRHAAPAAMPDDACLYYFDCPGCGVMLSPLPGDCCVFCSYGSVPCPSVQRRKGLRDAPRAWP
jgi:hypothetical protein